MGGGGGTGGGGGAEWIWDGSEEEDRKSRENEGGLEKGEGGESCCSVDATEKRAQKLWPLSTTLHTVVLAAYIAFLFSDYAAALDIFLQI